MPMPSYVRAPPARKLSSGYMRIARREVGAVFSTCTICTRRVLLGRGNASDGGGAAAAAAHMLSLETAHRDMPLPQTDGSRRCCRPLVLRRRSSCTSLRPRSPPPGDGNGDSNTGLGERRASGADAMIVLLEDYYDGSTIVAQVSTVRWAHITIRTKSILEYGNDVLYNNSSIHTG
mmetsp:Transcript_1305/g.3552  ORF Transcript_1305/g.3552 Transcript_1305/m.3552 type:complete len:176 (+) Transcript_1305:285-812(+)